VRFRPLLARGAILPQRYAGLVTCTEWSLVPIVRVDDVVDRIGTAPDVMKIDVEGAELDVLRGAEAALRSKHPRVFLSVHSDELRRSCLDFLSALGYRATPLVPEEIRPTEYILA
jgi:hypothetical protein